MGRPTKARQVEITERRTRAIQLRNAGASWTDIANELGYANGSAASNDVTRALDVANRDLTESVEVFRDRELDRLDQLRQAAVEVLERHHVTVQNGKVVRLDDEPLLDDAPVLAAIDRLVKISESQRKLLGLDSAVKVETSGAVRFEVAGVDVEGLK